jgi:hypothetical protein
LAGHLEDAVVLDRARLDGLMATEGREDSTLA